MIGFVIAALAVAVAVALAWLSLKAADGSTTAGVALAALVIIVLGAILNVSLKVSDKGPCHQYETRLMYNAATKTMMPSRACVLRGEWLEEPSHDNQ